MLSANGGTLIQGLSCQETDSLLVFSLVSLEQILKELGIRALLLAFGEYVLCSIQNSRGEYFCVL